MAKVIFLQENPMYEALGVHALAGQVKAAGHDCDVIIESMESDFFNSVKLSKADLFAFSIMTRQQEWAIARINALRREIKTPILIGGTHPTMYPETLEHCLADFLCVGEGDHAIVDLLDRIESGQPTNNIPNIHAKVDGEIYKNPIRPLINSWGDIALPDRSAYSRYPFIGELPLKRFITSFGCAYKCSFCYINNFREAYKGKGKFFRRKSVKRVIEEMVDTRNNYPFKRIHFVDDIFSLDKEWLREFLPVYSSEIGLPWTANIWIQHMDYETTKMFKEHGCTGLTFGVEAGDEETRRNMLAKNLPDKTYIKNCKNLKDFGITFHTGNIIGLPNQGIEEAINTARFNRKIGSQSTRAGLFWPFPGTRLTDYAMEQGVLEGNYDVKYFNRGIYPIVKHPQSDELTLLANLFQLVAKWQWFEHIARFLMRRPKSKLSKFVAFAVDQLFWIYEARFFGLLNYSGLKYYYYLHNALSAMKRHDADPRFVNDAKGQRPFWDISDDDIKSVYTRDGMT